MSARTLHAHAHAHAHGTGRVRAHVTNLRLPGEYDRRRGKFSRRTAKAGMQFNDCVRLADPAPSIQTVTRIMHFYRPARGCRLPVRLDLFLVLRKSDGIETFEIMSPSWSLSIQPTSVLRFGLYAFLYVKRWENYRDLYNEFPSNNGT